MRGRLCINWNVSIPFPANPMNKGRTISSRPGLVLRDREHNLSALLLLGPSERRGGSESNLEHLRVTEDLSGGTIVSKTPKLLRAAL